MEIKKCKKGMEARQKDYYCWKKQSYVSIPTAGGRLIHDLYMVSGYIHGKSATEATIICFSAEDTPEKIILELERTKLMFVFGDDRIPFLTTKKVLTTLSQRAGSKQGDFAMRDERKIRFHRDAGYVAYLKRYVPIAKFCIVLMGKIKKSRKSMLYFLINIKCFPRIRL